MRARGAARPAGRANERAPRPGRPLRETPGPRPGPEGGEDGAGGLLGAGMAAAPLPPARRGYGRLRGGGAGGAGGPRSPGRPVPGWGSVCRGAGSYRRGFCAAEAVAVMSVDVGSESMKIAIVKPGVPMEIVLNK